MSGNPNRLSNIHIDRNGRTRGDWQTFAPHRGRVTELIVDAADGANPSLCVLGAGNGNDLDLALLAERFGKITLVDLDRHALEHCRGSQPAQVAARIETLGEVDLCGLLEPLDRFDGDSAQFEQLITTAQRPEVAMPATYDVVASTCLLTQMIDSVVAAIGPQHPRFPELALALRDGHLRLLCDATSSGGTALLVTDFVSSDTVPPLNHVPDEQLETLAAQAIHERNFFMGVNPGVLARHMQSLAGGRVELYPPWRWRMGNRAYAVCAIGMKKP